MKVKVLQEVPTSDGPILATDVWLPDGIGPFPVLLVANTIPSTRGNRIGRMNIVVSSWQGLARWDRGDQFDVRAPAGAESLVS